MKHTKITAAGLVMAMMLSGSTMVFAATDSTAADTNVQKQESMSKLEQPDMSGLELPEGFVAFDPDHVPDGKHAPEKGEIKAIEFDADGKMISGMAPDGERPELPDGQAPQMENGQAPELPDGQMPPMGNGQAPQMNDGQAPQLPDGQAPQMNGGQAPQMNGGQGPQMNNGQN
ncbi:MAG: hypothetical protein IJ121_03635 [Eubacterium sp.]|nr:hypothetical protein [Eubacterium sp.]